MSDRPVKNVLTYLLIALLTCVYFGSMAQFYNGHQMSFGKNRVQYEEFDWFFMRHEKFDTYFYTGGKELAETVAEIAYQEIENMSSRLDYKLNKRLIFVVYHNLSDFRQSNIGLQTLSNEYNIGGVTTIVDNIVFLYVEGDQQKLQEQLRSSITEVMINQILFGSDWKNKAATNTLMILPDWYYKGLISYLSNPWDEQTENYIKDGIMNGRYEKINHLSGEEAIYAGHSIWYYIASTYGEEVIPTILYLTRVSKNIESGFLYVLGINLKSLSYSWNMYFYDLFKKQVASSNNPEGNQQLKRSGKDRKYQEAAISPDGNKLAYASNIMGKMKIFIKDIHGDKKIKIYRQGHKLDQITDYTYPRIKWHPTGKLLGFIVEKKGKIYYLAYNLNTKEIKETELRGFDKVNEFDFSDNGMKIVFNGFKNGRSDIFIYNLTANTYQNLTYDQADDFHPVFINDSKQILFLSNRSVDSLGDTKTHQIPIQQNRDIFLYDTEKTDNQLTQLTKTPLIDEKEAYLTEDNYYIYLSNKTGVYNRYAAKYDSVISYIDTVTHYRYFMRSHPMTNYKMNILEHELSEESNMLSEIYYQKKSYNIFTEEINPEKQADPDNTYFREAYVADFKTIAQQKEEKKTAEPEQPKDSLININAYELEPDVLETKEKEGDFDEDGNLKKKLTNKYLTNFYTSRIINQIDFGFLNASYQKFTGSAFYFNPGFNILFNVEAMDLFEDYRITGGFRFAGNFDSNEYLFGFEDLSSRLNKQYIFHRQTMRNMSSNNIYNYKSYLNQGMFVLRYPFNQVSAVQSTLTFRQDKQAYLTTDFQNLLRENEFDYWGGLKLEYIFDNTRNLMININEGGRFKIFGEYYKQIDQKETDLFVVGCDFRHYLPIHRNLILASRFAASGSFGSALLVYYLGGVDNWINISNETPIFDHDTRIDPEANYVYQAVATNMRGFTQNIRNGNNFALINTELRWPIISYFINRPINSDFLNNFQVIGFFDVGTAWSGPNPLESHNAYESEIYENGPVTVIIDKNSSPLVAGYGIGLRTRLLGYFVRLDYARGIENNTLLPPMIYLSLNLDF
ncbi:MAG: hypothetical protein ACP5DZ_08485 [Bacteroidales bacterium]